MSWRWYIPAAKQPVPADGLRVDRFGDTWWGAQWISALQALGAAYRNRLPRGSSYARQGRVVDVVVGAGEVSAGVVGSRRHPYQVSLRLQRFSEEQWRQVVEVLADEALFTIRLLRQELPPEVAERLRQRGLSLFPTGRDLQTSCSCPDWANPCKHVAAVHYVVAAALDNDPFLIFALRGLERDALLSALAESRGTRSPVATGSAIAVVEEAGERWEEPSSLDEAAYLGTDTEPPDLSFDLGPPAVDLAGLRRLGPPPAGLDRLPALLAPAIRRAGRAALKIATAEERQETVQEADNGSSAAASPARPVSTAVLRQDLLQILGGSSEPLPLRQLAGRLGCTVSRLRPVVNALRQAGAVELEGERRSARYRLAEPATQAPPRPGPRRAGPGSAQQSGEGSLRGQVLELLRNAGEPLPLRSIADLLGQPVERLRPVVNDLRGSGNVVRVGERRAARYRAAEPGQPQHRRSRSRSTKPAPAPAPPGSAPPAGSLARQVLDLLLVAPEPLPLRRIAEQLGQPVQQLRPVVAGLCRERQVVMEGQRRTAAYRIAEVPRRR